MTEKDGGVISSFMNAVFTYMHISINRSNINCSYFLEKMNRI